ncbi:MAG: C69 family dipeptidase [Bacteroidales bacterium]|nr:C69 family dipeptidase [Bacteroidales bacterium]
MKRLIISMIALAILVLNWEGTQACTNFLLSKSSTADGSTMITYAADSHTRYGQLRYSPAADHQPGEMLNLYDYGSLKFRLAIPQPAHTYNVVGFINEHQLAIGETTWGGRAELEHGNNIGIDYGNLIYVTLMRAKNCREAIQVMDELTRTYGYCDGGESFSLCDPNEVWIFEIINRGEEKGALWVARRVPEGYVSGHANQARITQFPQEVGKFKKTRGKGLHQTISSAHMDYINEPEVECVYSADVVSFARNKGWFNGKDTDFSYADTYNPITFSGARACDARVYAFFNRVNSNMKQYEAYAMGDINAERLPLWIKPDHKISLHEVMNLMRDHYEGTPMDMTQDVGAGPFHLPYRWRPMGFEVDGKKYIHERAISTQQTGFSFVAQCRNWLPNKVGGILWFGVDDTYTTCYCPMFCSLTQIPECFREGNGSMSQYSETAAFWLFNRVANFCYLRYDVMVKDVQKVQLALETNFIEKTAIVDKGAELLKSDKELTKLVNDFSRDQATEMMTKWRELDHLLLMKYIDGNIKQEENGRILTTETGVVKYPAQPAYPEWFYRAIVNDHGSVIEAR